MATKKLLMIFLKNPEKGRVKTRLAARIGEEKAFEIYKALIERTKKATREIPFDKCVYYSSFIEHQDTFEKAEYKKLVQEKGDLGAKMRGAFEQAFADGYQEVCIIGSDCHELSGSLIREAFDHLKSSDVVIGPSQDGGYYLLGMRRLISGIFEGMPWSQAGLLRQTISFLEKNKYRYRLLPELNDIDTIEDIVQQDLLRILHQ